MSLDENLSVVLQEIRAHMLFPQDEKMRTAYVCSEYGAALSALIDEEADIAEVDLKTMRDLLQCSVQFGPLTDIGIARTRTGIFAWEFIGIIIWIFIVSITQDRNDIGKNRIYKTVYGNGLLRSLERVWSDYECVAHFCAAFMISDGLWSEDQDEVINFLSVAEVLRVWLTNYKPLRAHAPVVAPDKALVIGGFFCPVEFDLSHLKFSEKTLSELDLHPPDKTVFFRKDGVFW